MKKFLVVLVGFLVIGVTQAFPQTHRQMELWVGRVPAVSDTSLSTQCLRQTVFIYADKQRFGIVTETDTLALVATKQLNGRAILCTNLITDEEYVFESIIVDSGFIIFVTLQESLTSKYNLIYSTTPCYQTLSTKSNEY